MTDNFIVKALFISLVAHTTLLWTAYLVKINDPREKEIRKNRVEISYKAVPKRPVDIKERPIRPAKRLDLSNRQKILSQGTIPVSLVKKSPSLPFGMVEGAKPEHMRRMELSRKVSIMPVSSQKINNPVYAAYNEMVRDRIKQRVYANYDQMDSGSVYLTFLVDAQGVLKVAKIIAEKTNASKHLQEIALRSLKEASPFPSFLKGMNLAEYPFNIEIQYQVSE